MKNIFDVLKQKEDALKQLQTEIEALRIAARLLSDEEDTPRSPEVPAAPTPVFRAATPPARHGVPANGGSYSAAWGNAPRQFP